MRYLVKIGEKTIAVSIDEEQHPFSIKINGRPVNVSLHQHQGNSRLQLMIDNRPYEVEIRGTNGRYNVIINGRELDLYAEDERLAKIHQINGSHADRDHAQELRAPMPGLVTRVLKKEGEQVTKGESLVIVEAMKMENELRSPIGGIIAEVKVKPGQSIDKNAVLVVFK